MQFTFSSVRLIKSDLSIVEHFQHLKFNPFSTSNILLNQNSDLNKNFYLNLTHTKAFSMWDKFVLRIFKHEIRQFLNDSS